jgi:hypothetical protein
MTTAVNDRPTRSTRFRAVALVALASLSCATVRVPATGLPPTVKIQGDVAEPQVELWVESGANVSPEEAAKAAAEARAALGQALASRNLGAGEQLLVVRAQGVSRTDSRRTDQKAAVAGLVVAAVAIVAVVVVVLVASQGKAGGGGKVPAIHAPPAAVPRPPPAGVVAVRPPPLVPAAIPRPGTVPAPAPGAVRLPRPSGGSGHGGVAVLVGADIHVPITGPAPNGRPPAVWSETVVTGPPPAPADATQPDTEVILPPPPPLDVERRGFFAGDSTRLELTLVDRATARPLWVKVVEGDCDPRDAVKVRELLDRGLDDPAGWKPAS